MPFAGDVKPARDGRLYGRTSNQRHASYVPYSVCKRGRVRRRIIMAQFRDEEPTSGFVRPDDILKSERFTDFSVVPNRGYSLLVRAKRNGRWWMLKGLKEQYRQDTVYQVHHSAALLYHKHSHKSRHNSYSPQIVPARQVYAAGSAPLRFSDSPISVSTS